MSNKYIVMIPSGGTNLSSVQDALEAIGYSACLTADKKEIERADKVILPGVGAASHAMHILRKLNLVEVVQHLQQDVLGICVGMQLLFKHSEENNQDCLNIIPHHIKRLPTDITVPHMGWNELVFSARNQPIFNHILPNSFAYFTHSYYAPFDESYTLAYTEYEQIKISAVLKYRNFYGMQFHPERSSQVGLQLLSNFFDI